MVVWQALSATGLRNASTDPDPWTSRAGAFILHTAMVFVCAIIGFPWLIWRWIAWVQPYVHMPALEPAWSWYLPHIALVNLTLAVAVGYGMTRGLKAGAVWAWTVPTFVLGVKMLLFAHPPTSSVLFQTPPGMTALEYFFGILPETPPVTMPISAWPLDIDYERIVAQMRFTASFSAGVGYTLGALVARHELLTKMFVFEKPPEDEGAIASSDAGETEN
jgi:hypothetical protein